MNLPQWLEVLAEEEDDDEAHAAEVYMMLSRGFVVYSRWLLREGGKLRGGGGC